MWWRLSIELLAFCLKGIHFSFPDKILTSIDHLNLNYFTNISETHSQCHFASIFVVATTGNSKFPRSRASKHFPRLQGTLPAILTIRSSLSQIPPRILFKSGCWLTVTVTTSSNNLSCFTFCPFQLTSVFFPTPPIPHIPKIVTVYLSKRSSPLPLSIILIQTFLYLYIEVHQANPVQFS